MITYGNSSRFNSSYTSDAMSEEEAKKYAIKMGITDSLRGIQQMYGNLTGNDELLEKLKKKDKKLKKIFENPNYGDEVFKYYLGAAVVGDPVGYVPIFGWAKKAKTLSNSTFYGMGMGGAYTTVVGSSESLYWNPASISRVENTVFQFQKADWLVDTRLSTFSFSYPARRSISFGIYINHLDYGEDIVTTVDHEFGNGDYWNASDMVIGGGLSWVITDRFSIGTVLKYIRSNIYNESAASVASDIGLLYISQKRNIRFGSSISNIGLNMAMDGKDLLKKIDLDNENSGHNETILAKLKTNEWPLPIIFRIGLSGNFKLSKHTKLLLSTDAVLPSDDFEHLNIGFELTVYENLFIRAGLRNIGMRYSEEKYTFGIGSKFMFLNNLLEFNYAYQHFGLFGHVPHFEFIIHK